MSITLTIPGNPVGKQRARVCRTGHAYTPAKTVNYEALVKQTFAAKYPDFVPMPGPVRMTITIFVMPSKEAQKKIRRHPDLRLVFPTIKPDISNVLKIIEDALNGLAYVDDKQIVWVQVFKDYPLLSHLTPRVEIELEELT